MSDDRIDALSFFFNQMPDSCKPRPMTARGILAEAECGIYDKSKVREVLAYLKQEHEMRMQEGELSTKPIPWHVIVWEEGTIHLEITIITADRDMALLQAGADLAETISKNSGLDEDVHLSECQVSARPAV